jgi:hypothetical protein
MLFPYFVETFNLPRNWFYLPLKVQWAGRVVDACPLSNPAALAEA